MYILTKLKENGKKLFIASVLIVGHLLFTKCILLMTQLYQISHIMFSCYFRGVIGVGFYGNEGIASGLAHFVNVADQANGTIEKTESQVGVVTGVGGGVGVKKMLGSLTNE